MVVFTHTRPVKRGHHGDMNAQLPHGSTPPTDGPPVSNGASAPTLMTAATLDELRDELERLRKRAHVDIAQQLREARAFGAGSNNDEFHAVREEQLVLEARIAALEETIARAAVVDPGHIQRGTVVIGSTVLVEDLDSGAVSEYRIVGSHNSLGPDTISAASPMGRALVGATTGAVVTFDLPNGRSRSVRLADVATDSAPNVRSRAAA
jgi:transcription elongation factor GreA